MTPNSFPTIIQGGMGVAVSSWKLAKAVSRTGQLGVVSGTALDTVLARRLQRGDLGGHMRRALAHFPFAEAAKRIVERFFIPGGKPNDEPFSPMKVLSTNPTPEQLELVVAANFVEVFLAKEGHQGEVGINYLEKIQIPTLPSLYGAMLAGVGYVLMGAGIPIGIPGVLDRLSAGQPVELPLHIANAEKEDHFCTQFDAQEIFPGELPKIERPKFLAIIASASLAKMLIRKASGRVDGFVVEGPTAGGHNAPPRGKMQFNDQGEPIYGERDQVDIEAMGALERPFWLAGSYGTPDRLADALSVGATGVQVGTAFAFCEESGLSESIKQQVLQLCSQGKLDVFTDPSASPAGFPFKVLQLEETLSEGSLYEERKRLCDLGFLRQGYRKEDGSIGWRCPAEPVSAFVNKGGDEADTVDRKCVCNGLMSNIGLEQARRDGTHEAPLVTCGNDVNNLAHILESTKDKYRSASYCAADVVSYLLQKIDSAPMALS